MITRADAEALYMIGRAATSLRGRVPLDRADPVQVQIARALARLGHLRIVDDGRAIEATSKGELRIEAVRVLVLDGLGEALRHAGVEGSQAGDGGERGA